MTCGEVGWFRGPQLNSKGTTALGRRYPEEESTPAENGTDLIFITLIRMKNAAKSRAPASHGRASRPRAQAAKPLHRSHPPIDARVRGRPRHRPPQIQTLL